MTALTEFVADLSVANVRGVLRLPWSSIGSRWLGAR